MQTDLRQTELYREAEALHRSLRQPGKGLISDAAEVSTNGAQVAFTASIVAELNGAAPTRIGLTDLSTGVTRILTSGPNIDRLPRFSPDGQRLAFLSDRRKPGDFQLYLLDTTSGDTRAAPAVDGWIEYLHWSPDGSRILLGLAGYGADVAGAQGAVTSKQATDITPTWMPSVETGNESFRWRRVWVYELATDQVRQATLPEWNIWEAAWCGNDSLVAVVSPGPGEGLWYSATLHVITVATGATREVFTSGNQQLGWPAASPSGTLLAIVEAICSDRCIVAGDLRVIDSASGTVQRIDTKGVDVTYTEWRSDERLLVAGYRDFETVVGLYDAATRTYSDIWASTELSPGGRYISASGIGAAGDCALIGESFLRAPEVAVIRNGEYVVIKSFDLSYAEATASIAAVQPVKWQAPDALEIQGWLLLPQGPGPHPIVMNVHGGPVWHWHPAWLGRGGTGVPLLMLLKRGYAIFFPNPRGSTGRGQAFTRAVVGDMGGADATDCLSGLDHLVTQGIADPARLGVTGGSYGGFMTSWLITQDARFGAAVSVSPITNHVTEYLISNIPHFVTLFLGDHYTNPNGPYYQRSPIMHAHKARTPSLHICGALDRCTPPAEAAQFHNALLENGVESVLATYPEEGHWVRKWPSTFDYAARLVAWFETHLRPTDH